VSDDQPVIEGTLEYDRTLGWALVTGGGEISILLNDDWDGQRVRVMLREGHAAEWIVIERVRE
jgi:hypothetical protein